MTDAPTPPDPAVLQRITWDDDGYADFHDAEGFHRCPTITADDDGTVFVGRLISTSLTPDQARAIAARLIGCADKVEPRLHPLSVGDDGTIRMEGTPVGSLWDNGPTWDGPGAFRALLGPPPVT